MDNSGRQGYSNLDPGMTSGNNLSVSQAYSAETARNVGANVMSVGPNAVPEMIPNTQPVTAEVPAQNAGEANIAPVIPNQQIVAPQVTGNVVPQVTTPQQVVAPASQAIEKGFAIRNGKLNSTQVSTIDKAINELGSRLGPAEFYDKITKGSIATAKNYGMKEAS